MRTLIAICILAVVSLPALADNPNVRIVALKGGGYCAITHLTAAANGTTTLPARSNRRSVSVRCDTASPEAVYYGTSSGVNATTGAKLAAGESQVVDYVGALFFYGAAGTGTVTCVETYD